MKQALFFISLFLFLSIGFHKRIDLPPTSTHLGAQADRATLTYNYYTNNATFLYPKVMETRLNDGIVGCEFPGLYYILGNIFKFTGFNYAIYRLTIFAFMLLAFFSIWSISSKYFDALISSLLTLLLCLSPIVAFYSLNFLPDIPALGLSMAGWYFVLRNKNIKRNLIIGFILFSLAGLIKASYAMHLVTALSIFIVENKKLKWNVLLTALLGILCIGAWYEWATHLNHIYQNPHFLLKPNPAKGFPDFLSIVKDNWVNWSKQLHIVPLYFVLAFGLIATFINRKEHKLLFKITSRMLVCILAFYIVFQTQFKYHDYYYIAFIPMSFFLITHALLYIKRLTPNNVLIKIGLIILVFYSYTATQEAYKERYKTDSYWYMPPMPGTIEKYIGLHHYLDTLLPKGAAIIVANDNTPNSSLFFARRKGARIAPDFSEDLKSEILNDKRFPYAVINDSNSLTPAYFKSIGLNPLLIGEFNGLKVYKLQ